MRERLGARYAVITWKELNQSLYSALELEKTVLFFTLTLIIVVASLNIVAGLILLVMQKIKDIGILLSYGATAAQIRRIFFLQGAVIGILGTSLGVILGLGFCHLANRFELIKVPGRDLPGQLRSVPYRPPGPGGGDRRLPADQLRRHPDPVPQGGGGLGRGRRQIRVRARREIIKKNRNQLKVYNFYLFYCL